MTASPMRDRIAARVDRTARRLIDQAQRTHTPLAELTTVRVPWMQIRSSDRPGGGREAEILIYDEIGGSAGIQAEQFARDIADIDADVIKVRINSPGGSVFDALAIHSSLLHHPARIEMYVDGYAASAASVVAMAGDEIVMMPGSQFMIHDAGMVADGNAAELSKAVTYLDRQSNNLAGLYAARGGGDVDTWRALMLAETWMFAGEAVQFGLADRAEISPQARPAELEEAATRSHDLSKYGYRYEGREHSPAPNLETRITSPAGTYARSATRAIARTRVVDRGADTDRAPAAVNDLAERSVSFELEPSSDGLTLEGYAAVFNSPARIQTRDGDFDEVIMPGAFTRALAMSTPVLMFEHGRHPLIGSMPLGVITRTAEDSKGLYIQARLSDNWLIQPVRDAVRDRAVKGMSFRFSVAGGDQWQRRAGNVDLRSIYELETVPELGPVVFPAYEPTTASIRSLIDQVDHTFFAGRPDARSAGGSDARNPGPGRRMPTHSRQHLDDGALRVRGILL